LNVSVYYIIAFMTHETFPRASCPCRSGPKSTLVPKYTTPVVSPQGLAGTSGRPGAKVRGLLAFARVFLVEFSVHSIVELVS